MHHSPTWQLTLATPGPHHPVRTSSTRECEPNARARATATRAPRPTGGQELGELLGPHVYEAEPPPTPRPWANLMTVLGSSVSPGHAAGGESTVFGRGELGELGWNWGGASGRGGWSSMFWGEASLGDQDHVG